MKEYEELTFADNFMFCKILEENEYRCREMTELRLGRKSGNIIKDPKTEKAIKLTPDGHGIRFDVYFEDDEDTIYDIEMQTSNTAEIPKRSRYYQGMLDLNYLKEGKRYKSLPNSYIIFLCTFDLFEMGYHKYSFAPMCREDKSIELEDGTNRIFICAGGHRDDVSKELAAFIEYLTGKLSENNLVKDIQQKVQEARESNRWRAEYMTLRDMLDDEFERGIEQGIERGIERGIEQGIEQGLISVIMEDLEDLGGVGEDLRSRISVQGDVDMLRQWRRMLKTCSSVDEFVAAIDGRELVLS